MTSTGWNYSDLSRLAKLNGGPEMLINKIKAGSFQQGRAAGRMECLPAVLTLLLITGGVLILEEGPKLMNAIKSRRLNNVIIDEAATAEDILLKEMKDADTIQNNDM